MTTAGWLLATTDGVVLADPDGRVRSRALAGVDVVAVAAGPEEWVVATRHDGMLRRPVGGPDAGADWEPVGSPPHTIWTVALGRGGRVYAGVEPAALWCRDARGWRELTALASVDGASEWQSPWGAADLCSIAVEPRLDGSDRIVVGVEVGGVAVSDDGGEHFHACNDGLYDDVHRVVLQGTEWYATTGMGVHRSLDDAHTWSWEHDGIDRGYTQGLAICDGFVLVAASSGPPPLWERDGPEAAVFRSSCTARPLAWEMVLDGFEGNVERQALAASAGTAAAGTTAGELFTSDDTGVSWTMSDIGAPILAVAALPH